VEQDYGQVLDSNIGLHGRCFIQCSQESDVLSCKAGHDNFVISSRWKLALQLDEGGRTKKPSQANV
jgi:hypothetical protein